MVEPALCRYEVVHETRYTYSSSVASGHHFAHLTPRATGCQQVRSHVLEFEPQPSEITDIVDYFGNHCVRFLINRPHEVMQVLARSTLDVRDRSLDEAALTQAWEQALCESVYTVEPVDVAEMRQPSPLVECLPETRHYSSEFFSPGRPWVEAMLDLTRHIKENFVYDPKATTVSTPVAEVFATHRGVCQDFAHLMLSCLRSLGLPARYVSGYILNEPPPGQEKLLGADASHAWVESWLPGVGWIGFDPTNGKRADHEFITLAWGRDFMDVTPLRGVVLGGGDHELAVRVSVIRIETAAA